MIQIYTGDGKGKTTAALGLAMRAVGACKRVYICQFIKGKPYSELSCLKKIKDITVEQCGRGCFIKKTPSRIDIELAQKGFENVKQIIKSRAYDVVILDEINCALEVKLLALADMVALLKSAPRSIEIILTGRNAHPSLVRLADLVSEIREIKHYYRSGVKARKGIEF
jgi:cob(I)alamin adenosyltransferase